MIFDSTLVWHMPVECASSKEIYTPSWKSLTGVPNFTPDTMFLMTDATALVHESGAKDWYRFQPDFNGMYETAGATWPGPFPMLNSRQFFASGILADGRTFVVGTEYFNGSATPNDSPLGEIFNPQTRNLAAGHDLPPDTGGNNFNSPNCPKR